MIDIQNLGFSYGKSEVLRNISTRLEDGKIYGLLGENGVGKTTLLTLLCGLKKAAVGSVRVYPEDGSEGLDPFDREPATLSNQYYLPESVPALSVKAEAFARRDGKLWPDFDMDKFMEIMREFENDPTKKMSQMSAGQLKKTYISFALALNVKNLFMDEPTNGLDIPSKSQFRGAIMKYTRDDSTIVISTHQVRDLENIIDPIIILDKRDVLLNASVEEITSKFYFDYGSEPNPGALYKEMLPGGYIQVCPNTAGVDSKVNIEALFNTAHLHKDLVKSMFNDKQR